MFIHILRASSLQVHRDRHKSPMHSLKQKSKILKSSTALWPNRRLRDSDAWLQRGLLFPRIRQVMQWVREETMGDFPVNRIGNEENRKVSACCPRQQKGVV